MTNFFLGCSIRFAAAQEADQQKDFWNSPRTQWPEALGAMSWLAEKAWADRRSRGFDGRRFRTCISR
ncbi:MAG: hypothetical protein JO200_06715 [Comamonas sp.]|nr:hypothetical protein [Comamonas sp.]